MDGHKQSNAYLRKLPPSDYHEKWGGEDEYVEPKEPRIRVNFWVDESLYYAIKGKLLDHKKATRERVTITGICTKALQDYLNPKEGNEMTNTNWTDVINAHREAIEETILTARKEGATNNNHHAYAITPEGEIYGWEYVGNYSCPEKVWKGEHYCFYTQEPWDPTDSVNWLAGEQPAYGEEGYDEAVEFCIGEEIDALRDQMDEVIEDIIKEANGVDSMEE